jgi:VanZ family protein
LITLLHSWNFRFDRVIARDVVLNVLLYLPLGMAARLSLQRARPAFIQIGWPVALGFVLSSSIEMLQLYARRRCSMVDVTTNTLGALAGAIIAGTLRTKIESGLSHRRARAADPAALGVFLCWLAYTVFPFFPVLGRTGLMAKWRIFVAAPLFEPVPFVSSACAIVIVASLAKPSGLTSPWTVPVAAMIMGPVQFFIATKQPLPSSWLGIVVGWLLLAAMPNRLEHLAAAWTVIIATAVRGLAPFRLSSTPTSFRWVPFEGFLQGSWFSATGILIEKVFFYAALIWGLRIAGASLRATIVVVTLGLAAVEIAQMYLPGRTPEITDVLLPVIIGYVTTTGRLR